MSIIKIHARQIFDSRGNPTIEVDVVWKRVTKAVDNFNTRIADELLGISVFEQNKIDQIMIDLDGSHNKSNLGASVIRRSTCGRKSSGKRAWTSTIPLRRRRICQHIILSDDDEHQLMAVHILTL